MGLIWRCWRRGDGTEFRFGCVEVGVFYEGTGRGALPEEEAPPGYGAQEGSR